MNNKLIIAAIAVILSLLPFIGVDSYQMHLIIMILIWSFAYTAWSVMGRFGLVSLGHGAFMAVGGYGTCPLYTSPSPRDLRGSRMPFFA